MVVLAWILFILSSLDALKSLFEAFFGDELPKRLYALFQLAIRGLSVYLLIEFLFLSHTVIPWMAITVAAVNGIFALASFFYEEPVERFCGFIFRGLYCVGFIVLL